MPIACFNILRPRTANGSVLSGGGDFTYQIFSNVTFSYFWARNKEVLNNKEHCYICAWCLTSFFIEFLDHIWERILVLFRALKNQSVENTNPGHICLDEEIWYVLLPLRKSLQYYQIQFFSTSPQNQFPDWNVYKSEKFGLLRWKVYVSYYWNIAVLFKMLKM